MSTLKGAQVKATAEISLTVSATNGDRQRLKEIIEYIFRTMYPVLVTMALKITNYDQELAEEILSITVTKLLEKNPELPPDDIMKNGYMYTCIRNNFYTYQKRKKETTEEIPDKSEDPDYGSRLEEILEPLPVHLRDCLRLYYLDGFKYKEIAKDLGISLYLVSKFILEGIELLKQIRAEQLTV